MNQSPLWVGWSAEQEPTPPAHNPTPPGNPRFSDDPPPAVWTDDTWPDQTQGRDGWE